MADEYPCEGNADYAIECIREFIDVEKHFVKDEHELFNTIMSLVEIVSHLYDVVSEDKVEFLDELTDKLAELQDIVESDSLKNLRIEKEEEHILNKLKEDIKHREWRAVKDDIEKLEKDEKKALKLEHHELRQVKSHFKELKKIIKKSKLVPANKEDLAEFKQKSDYEKQEIYYFLHLYKSASAYEKIFRDLFNKEKKLMGKLN